LRRKEAVELYKQRMAVERRSKNKYARSLCYLCIPAVAIVANKIGRPEIANKIAVFTYKNLEKAPKAKNKPKNYFNTYTRGKASDVFSVPIYRRAESTYRA
jgi:hypothetical protein